MKHYRDARTGLTVGVPPGWQSIKTPLVAGVLRLAEPVPDAVFRPTAVATVVEVAPDESVAIFTERTTRALIGELGGRVLNVGVWMVGELEGREVLTTYATGGAPLSSPRSSASTDRSQHASTSAAPTPSSA